MNLYVIVSYLQSVLPALGSAIWAIKCELIFFNISYVYYS